MAPPVERFFSGAVAEALSSPPASLSASLSASSPPAQSGGREAGCAAVCAPGSGSVGSCGDRGSGHARRRLLPGLGGGVHRDLDLPVGTDHVDRRLAQDLLAAPTDERVAGTGRLETDGQAGRVHPDHLRVLAEQDPREPPHLLDLLEQVRPDPAYVRQRKHRAHGLLATGLRGPGLASWPLGSAAAGAAVGVGAAGSGVGLLDGLRLGWFLGGRQRRLERSTAGGRWLSGSCAESAGAGAAGRERGWDWPSRRAEGAAGVVATRVAARADAAGARRRHRARDGHSPLETIKPRTQTERVVGPHPAAATARRSARAAAAESLPPAFR